MKFLYFSMMAIIFVAGASTVFAQSSDARIQNGVSSVNFTCIDSMTQIMKTKYASFDEERAKTVAVSYDAFKSEVKNDTYTFRAVSQEWTNDQVKCDATLKTVLVLFTVTDASEKDRDVTVLINPESYTPQGIDVQYDVPTHGGVVAVKIQSPLKQLESGILATQVTCQKDFVLVIKSQDNSPACIKPDTASKLAKRGWTMTVPVISGNIPLPAQSTGKCITGDPTFSEDLLGLIYIQKNASNQFSGKSYSPQVATVMIGINATVGWINGDDTPSSVTSNDGSFDSGPILPGIDHIWKHKFDCAGTYEYHSEPHPWMKGIVVVVPYSIRHQ